MRQTRVLCNDGRDRCMGALLDSVSFGSGPSRDDGAGAVRRGKLRRQKGCVYWGCGVWEDARECASVFGASDGGVMSGWVIAQVVV